VSVFSSEEIKRRLQEPISNSQSLVITPLSKKDFDQDAIDLRLGCYFRLPAMSCIPCIMPYASSDAEDAVRHYPELVHQPYGRHRATGAQKEPGGERWSRTNSSLILQPHRAVLASTLEYIKMPADASAEILTKSSWARIFISIASAPWIHPLYRGCLTLEISNLGNVPVALPVGKPIAQLVLMGLEGQDEIQEDFIKGTYVGAIMPGEPSFGG
jgi:deoxycytidine triphosphate deaminase